MLRPHLLLQQRDEEVNIYATSRRNSPIPDPPAGRAVLQFTATTATTRRLLPISPACIRSAAKDPGLDLWRCSQASFPTQWPATWRAPWWVTGRTEQFLGKKARKGRQTKAPQRYPKLRAVGSCQDKVWEALRLEQGDQRELLEVPTACNEGCG